MLLIFAAAVNAATVAAPTFTPAAGTYASVQSVTITSTTSGASIRYTTDGSTPSSTAGTLYSSAVSISSTTTLKAVGYKTGYTTSSVTSGTYTINLPTAVAPVFSPAAGTYTSIQSVAITSTTSGASIRYTTDGSTPSETAGTLYSSTVSIGSTATMKAIAYKTGYKDSTVTSGTYTINLPTAAAPTFSPAAGTYTSIQSVTISSTTSGASIRYTTDGSTPSSTAGTLYSGAVSISATTTLKAIAYKTGYTNSTVTSGTYTITLPAAAPTFSPAAGTYTSAQTVIITSTTSGASIRYTTDGSTPSETAGTLYSAAVSVSATTTLKAIAYKSGYSDSTVASGTYTITLPAAAPTFSPAAGTYTSAQTVTITSTTSGASIRYTTDGSTPSETVGTLYSSAVSISATTTLKAIAYKSGYTDSTVTSGTYTINLPTAVAPVFSPAAGTYTSIQSVAITSTTSGASIRYTTDGSTPSETTGTLYSGAVSIGATVTLKAIAYKTGYKDSAVTSGTYTINLPTAVAPAFSPAAGTYTSTQSVGITSTTSGASIRYTTDGSTPSETAGTLYSSAVSISATTTLKAIAYNTGYKDSSVTSGTYTINLPTAVAPAFSPAAGTYTGTQSVSITSTTSGASIRYTTDGSTPSETVGTLYSSAVSISATTTLKAIAYKTGYKDSTVTSGTYTINLPTAVAPAFSPAAGTYTGTQSVSITSTTSGASIRYTTDGSTPSETAGTLYSSAVSISATATLKAIAYKTGYKDSSVTSGTYTLSLKASAPTFSPAAGTYTGTQSVTIASTTSGASIRYTTDGSTPTETAGTLYSGPVSVSSSLTVKALAYRSGYTDSTVSSAAYVIQSPGINIEAERMTPIGTGATASAVSDSSASGGSYECLNATSASNSGQPVCLTLTTSSIPAGAYQVQFRYNVGSSRGQLAVSIDGAAIGGVIDQYASSSGYVTATLGNVTFGYTGTHSVILTVTGENASSSGYAITADKFNFLALTSQASAPDFSLAAGYYATTQTVTISSTTSGATIRYTTDGSTPTEANGTVYSGPITLGSSTMLKAIAYGVGVADSSITSSAFMVVTPQPLLNVLCDVNPRFVGGTATAASGVVQGSDGSFYGIISQGGTAGDGSIFRMTPGGTMTILVTFTGANGAYPQGSLLLGTDGNFYGTTSSGGPNNGGTFFQMTPSGVLTTLFSFSGTNNAYPGPLTLGADGNFYGTTGGDGTGNLGEFFKITPSGILTKLGLRPSTSSIDPNVLVLGNDGNFYIADIEGGIFTSGEIFKFAPSGALTSLVTFNGANGMYPHALTLGSDGFLYGSAGELFRLSSSGKFSVIDPSFYPWNLCVGGDGNLYGSAGTPGTIYMITPAGVENPVANYDSANGSTILDAPLSQGRDGNLYGTVSRGGNYNGGAMVQLIMPTYPPEFNVDGGLFNSAQTVVISSQNAVAIYYTTDGSTPTTASPLYTRPIMIASDTLLQAIAVSGCGVSSTSAASFLFEQQVGIPVFSVPTGTYSAAQNVTIASSTVGATIRYTTDGTVPSRTNGTLYAGVPISITGTAALAAIAYEDGFADSTVASATYTLNLPPATPVLSPIPGIYPDDQLVTITSIGATTIYYTTDGTVPTAGSLVYSGPVTVSTTQTLRAIGFNGNGTSGAVGGVYSFAQRVSAPVFSPEPGNYATPQTLTISSSTSGAIIVYTTDGSIPTGPNGTIYTGSINLGNSATLRAFAYASGMGISSVVSGNYSIVSAGPNLLALADFASSNGSYPCGNLIECSDGCFYGTTSGGGTQSMGTVFKMTRTGTIQTLASFSGTNGNSPQGGLILGSDGCLYGTTHSGGPANDGVIFKMTPLGVLTALTSFNGANGQYPNGRLVIGNDGCFYGTTLFGGSGSGTIFKVNLSGTLTTLVSFSGSNGFPIAGLVLGTDGNFYGACSGTIFKMTPSGGISTFATFTDPNIWGVCDGLAQGKDGNFYGTTRLGGSNDDGTVFTVSPSGVLTTLFSFNGTNGGQPCSGLIQGNDGNLYGTTESGGQGDGTVFMISPGGSLTTLVSFDGTNGGAPQASLLLGSDGDLYGTTNWGGLNGLGNVFQIVLQAAGQPVFSPSAGTFIGSQSVAISSPTPSASIRYTTDGTVPSETNGVVYSSPVLLSQPCRLQAIACLAGEADSPVTSGLYDVVPPAATPAFSAGSGTYWGGQTITISSATPGAVIRYTLDGSLPSESAGYLYTSPLQIGTSMSINAIAYRVGCLDSGIASASYTIVAPAAAPTFSTAPGGQSVAISCATVGASIRYTLDGSTPSETNGITYVGPVNITVPTTIKAIAYGVGFSDSVVSVVAVGIPTISITTPANGGTVNN